MALSIQKFAYSRHRFLNDSKTTFKIIQMKAFQSSLEGFEQPGSSPEEKLNSLVGKTVKIKASKSTKDSEKSLIEKISLV